MKIQSINNTIFKAKIIPNKCLDEGFSMAEKCAKSESIKDLNYAKEFLDGIVRIGESEKIPNFKIEIDKRRLNYTYTKINDSRVNGGPNEFMQNVNDDYLVVESIKKYANTLAPIGPSHIDLLKVKTELAEKQYLELKNRYRELLQEQLEHVRTNIFNAQ